MNSDERQTRKQRPNSDKPNRKRRNDDAQDDKKSQKKEVSLFEIFDEINEDDEFFNSKLREVKNIVSISTEVMFTDTQQTKTILEKTYSKPKVSIKIIGDYVLIDLAFKNMHDVDLKLSWRIFERYASIMDAYVREDDNNEYPILSFSITPKKYNGKYFILAHTPTFWSLQPTSPEQEDYAMLRAVFPTNNVDLLTPTYNVDDFNATEKVREQMREEYKYAVEEKVRKQEEENPYNTLDGGMSSLMEGASMFTKKNNNIEGDEDGTTYRKPFN